MKPTRTRILIALSLIFTFTLTLATATFAQAKPEYDMGKMQMIFLTRSSEAGKADPAKGSGERHRAFVEKLIREGRVALWGEMADETPLREVLVIKTESLDEARQLADSLPLVKEGALKADLLSWYAARNLITAAKWPLAKSDYVFGILVRGSKWTREQTEETKKLQEGHMANINRLAEAGKLVLAGPFYGDGDRRGIFIFKVDSIAEAQALTDTDPAVSAGRLKIELYRWRVPAGMLP